MIDTGTARLRQGTTTTSETSAIRRGLMAAGLVLAELVATRSDRRFIAASAGLSAAILIGFVINRTVGMPGSMDDIGNWSEPLGMISLLVEGAVFWLGARAWLDSEGAR